MLIDFVIRIQKIKLVDMSSLNVVYWNVSMGHFKDRGKAVCKQEAKVNTSKAAQWCADR